MQCLYTLIGHLRSCAVNIVLRTSWLLETHWIIHKFSFLNYSTVPQSIMSLFIYKGEHFSCAVHIVLQTSWLLEPPWSFSLHLSSKSSFSCAKFSHILQQKLSHFVSSLFYGNYTYVFLSIIIRPKGLPTAMMISIWRCFQNPLLKFSHSLILGMNDTKVNFWLVF